MSGPAHWSGVAAGYDEEADQGPTRDEVQAAWRTRLREWLPAHPSDVADLGCGTGSLAMLAAEDDHRVTAIDFADAMLERAREKADDAGLRVRFLAGDAAAPPLQPASVDVVLVRQVLWALPDPALAVQVWSTLLRPGGHFVLVESNWPNGAGLRDHSVAALLEPYVQALSVERLTDPGLWRDEIDDERYVIRGTLA